MRRALKYVVGIVLALVVGFGGLAGWIWWEISKPYTPRDAVDAHVRQETRIFGSRVDLVPTVFQRGQGKSEIISWFDNAGYTQMKGSNIWDNHGMEFRSGSVMFSRSVSTFACNLHIYAFLHFDNEDRLDSASATLEERGCL
ncbi:MAG TPA: hypothetical protein PKE65_01450 [Rhizobiaceae bacterium]|nr:hypothetical protein [Rhizobiaceae bacterium]